MYLTLKVEISLLLTGQSAGGYTGDYILGAASVALSRLRHNRVMQIMSQILEDLVQGRHIAILRRIGIIPFCNLYNKFLSCVWG